MIDRHSPTSEPIEELAARWVQSQPMISAYISSAVGDFHDAEDLLQEVARVAASRFSEYDRSRPFSAWAMGIARNLILKHYRTRTHDRHVFNTETLQHVADAFERMDAQAGAIRRALRQCVEQIQGRARQAFELRYFRDLKPTDIAQSLGMTANYVFVTLHRVRKALANCIDKQLQGEGVRR